MLKSKKIFPVLTIILAVFLLSCQKDSSSPLSKNNRAFKIRGVVKNQQGSGVKDAEMQIMGTNYASADTTDSEGIFAFENVKSGNYKVIAQKDSTFFIPSEKDIICDFFKRYLHIHIYFVVVKMW